jgi:hypothetical protein
MAYVFAPVVLPSPAQRTTEEPLTHLRVMSWNPGESRQNNLGPILQVCHWGAITILQEMDATVHTHLTQQGFHIAWCNRTWCSIVANPKFCTGINVLSSRIISSIRPVGSGANKRREMCNDLNYLSAVVTLPANSMPDNITSLRIASVHIGHHIAKERNKVVPVLRQLHALNQADAVDIMGCDLNQCMFSRRHTDSAWTSSVDLFNLHDNMGLPERDTLISQPHGSVKMNEECVVLTVPATSTLHSAHFHLSKQGVFEIDNSLLGVRPRDTNTHPPVWAIWRFTRDHHERRAAWKRRRTQDNV